MLDLLTFALCHPYSETTEGAQFDSLLELVASHGRIMFQLFQVRSSLPKVTVKQHHLEQYIGYNNGDTSQSELFLAYLNIPVQRPCAFER